MIRIYIGGKPLEIPRQELHFSFSNMRFSDVLADAYSTDMEIPLTDWNIATLDAWGLLDRPQQLFGERIACQVVTSVGMFAGRLQVSSLTDTTATATLYLSELPEALDGKVRDILTDDANTILDMLAWKNRAYDTPSTIGLIHKNQYDAFSPNIIRMPNVAISQLYTNIGNAIGMTMPLVDDTLRIVLSRMVVCPQNPRQLVNLSCDTTQSVFLAGQHVADTIEDNIIKFNRTCSVNMTIYINGIGQGAIYVALQKKAAGEQTWNDVYNIATTSSVHVVPSFYVANGDELRLYYHSWTGSVILDMTLGNYDILPTDYETALEYDHGTDYSLPTWYTGNGGYVYLGTYCNLPDITLRELLSAVAWYLGKVIEVDATSIIYADSERTAAIEAKIDTYNIASDAFGQLCNIMGSNDEVFLSWSIANTALEPSKTLYKSPFLRLSRKQYSSGEWATIDMFDTESPYKFVGLDGTALCVATTNGNVVYLAPCEAPDTLGLDEVTRVMEIEGRTMEDIRHMDYVLINGHRYMVEGGDLDEQSGLINFKALLI